VQAWKKSFIGAGQAEALRRVRYRIHRALSKIVRRRERFADNDLAALAQDNAVGKSSADIDADDVFRVVRIHKFGFWPLIFVGGPIFGNRSLLENLGKPRISADSS
jgi:hypothetical protein